MSDVLLIHFFHVGDSSFISVYSRLVWIWVCFLPFYFSRGTVYFISLIIRPSIFFFSLHSFCSPSWSLEPISVWECILRCVSHQSAVSHRNHEFPRYLPSFIQSTKLWWSNLFPTKTGLFESLNKRRSRDKSNRWFSQRDQDREGGRKKCSRARVVSQRNFPCKLSLWKLLAVWNQSATRWMTVVISLPGAQKCYLFQWAAEMNWMSCVRAAGRIVYVSLCVHVMTQLASACCLHSSAPVGFFSFSPSDDWLLINMYWFSTLTSTSLIFHLMWRAVCAPHSSTISYSLADSLRAIALCRLALICSLSPLTATSFSLPLSFWF